MQSDTVIWSTISKSFCSFKTSTTTQQFCRNEYNLTGLCTRQSCPLANSSYATVRLIDGVVYLFIKTPERAHSPANLWQKIKLSKSYSRALTQIDSELEYSAPFIIHKCKQRLTKITQSLIKSRRLLKKKTKVIGVSRSVEKRLEKREAKAEIAAKLTTSIEQELLDRLRRGVYGDDILNDRFVRWFIIVLCLRMPLMRWRKSKNMKKSTLKVKMTWFVIYSNSSWIASSSVTLRKARMISRMTQWADSELILMTIVVIATTRRLLREKRHRKLK